MYAIVQTGGKQYRVNKGDVITVEKLNAEVGAEVVLDEVLVLGEGADVKVGNPFVEGAAVAAKVLENGKGKKVVIYKYKAKKDYRKKQGHRQPYTKLEITDLAASGEKKKAAPAAAAPAAPAAEEVKKPALKSMKKAELIEFAKNNGIALDPKATNADMIAAIEAALNK